MIKVTLDHGSTITLAQGATVAQAFEALGLAKDAPVVAARINGDLVDLSRPLPADCTIAPIRLDSPEGLEIMRHSAAHLMAEAVRDLFPGVKVAIGPAIESGFYYDFGVPEPFTPEDLAKIETHMAELTAQDLPFRRDDMSREQAINYFRSEGEAYKVELLEEIPQEKVSLYQQGNFIDLCRGPHIPSTGFIKAFKLTATSGAYWRGDERRPMLQRIYGTAFATQDGTGAPPGTSGGGQTPGPPPSGPGVGAVQH